ncbi:uncharacterized protein LOC128202873 [Mya arenaria]|uniref:uncharacterized protein LOC128202873 n=1 Tax=Mya arenaria TaxID=6604 RepID=UPI0022E88586|nr:uncharacterized protein LOC128202873 [Mya arenaria]
MMMSYIAVLFILPCVAGLQCPSCTYINTPANIPSVIRSILESILGLFQDDKCTRPINGPTAGVNEMTCAPPEGQVARCSHYKGELVVNAYFTDLPLNIDQRGCYYSLPANVPSNKCHDRNNINEDKTFIKQMLDRVASGFTSFDAVSFKGTLCLCSDTYCATSGASKGLNGGNLGPTISFILSIITVLVAINLI